VTATNGLNRKLTASCKRNPEISMRKLICGSVVLCVAAGSAANLRAGEKLEPQAIVAKAIAAMGGEKTLSQYKATIFRGHCKFYGNGHVIDCTGEWFEQLPRQIKAVYQMHVGGKEVTRVEVITRDAAWFGMGGKVRALPPDQLAEIREGMDAGYAATVLPLKNPEYRLSLLGDSQVSGRAVVGLKVSRDGHRDVFLYFDKERGYVLKMVCRVKDRGDHEIEQETFYGDYRDFGGFRNYGTWIVNRDGKPFLELEITDFKAVEKLPDSIFAKPELTNPPKAPAAASTR
jgi:hypothetical protein